MKTKTPKARKRARSRNSTIQMTTAKTPEPESDADETGASHGGVRVPGEGKVLGRPPKKKGELRINYSITMAPSSWDIVNGWVEDEKEKNPKANRGTILEALVLRSKKARRK